MNLLDVRLICHHIHPDLYHSTAWIHLEICHLNPPNHHYLNLGIQVFLLVSINRIHWDNRLQLLSLHHHRIHHYRHPSLLLNLYIHRHQHLLIDLKTNLSHHFGIYLSNL